MNYRPGKYNTLSVKRSQCQVKYEKTLNGLGFMVFYAIFNNISAISWTSVLLVVETGVAGENHRSVARHCQILSYNVVSSTPGH
jgi:hypothetical protein